MTEDELLQLESEDFNLFLRRDQRKNKFIVKKSNLIAMIYKPIKDFSGKKMWKSSIMGGMFECDKE